MYSFDSLYESEILYDYQYGFRFKHGTQHAPFALFERLCTSIDVKNSVISLFNNFKKVFDTVNYKILLCKIYAYGIRGPLL